MNNPQRIEAILNLYKINATELAEQLGVQRSGISHLLSGRNNPSLDFLIKLKENFPELRWDFLIYGQLPMEESSQSIQKHPTEKHSYSHESSSSPIQDNGQKSLQPNLPQQATPQELHLDADQTRIRENNPQLELDTHKPANKANFQPTLPLFPTVSEPLVDNEESPYYGTKSRYTNSQRQKPADNPKHSIPDEEIDRIIIFYKNGSFKAYQPQE